MQHCLPDLALVEEGLLRSRGIRMTVRFLLPAANLAKRRVKILSGAGRVASQDDAAA